LITRLKTKPHLFFQKMGSWGVASWTILSGESFKKIPFCPISASDSNFNPRNTRCIPLVKIIVFLDLEQN
jgi:hypothetical protein